MLKNEKLCSFLKTYDIMIPVPISKNRKKERGYNQSYLIARELGKRLNITLEKNCLYKVKNNIQQSKLDKQDRKNNILGVYKLKNPSKLKNKKIILLDDIYTTGSTVNECCKTIKNNVEVDEICVFTIAKD